MYDTDDKIVLYAIYREEISEVYGEIDRWWREMAETTIQAVLEAESDAQKWETEARQQACDIVEKAKNEVKELIMLAEEQAKAERQSQIEKSKSDAENTARAMEESARKKAEDLYNRAYARKDEAVKELVSAVLS